MTLNKINTAMLFTAWHIFSFYNSYKILTNALPVNLKMQKRILIMHT